VRPAEIIYPGDNSPLRELLRGGSRAAFPPANAAAPETAPAAYGWMLNGYEDWVFAPETAVFTVRDHFKVASLDGFGLKDRVPATGAAGAVLHYLGQHLRRDLASLARLTFYQRSDFLTLDYTTLRHLEILEPLQHDAPRNACLFGAMNRAVTPMGARKLRAWLSQPLAAVESIRQRQGAVQSLVDGRGGLEALRGHLAQVRDLERTVGRLSVGNGNARDLAALRQALEQLPTLKQVLQSIAAAPGGLADRELPAMTEPAAGPGLLAELEAQIQPLPELAGVIARAIVDEPPLAVKEGGLFRDGYDPALDELRTAMRGGKDWIAKLQQTEIERTGIPSLKIRFNSVFGYYIEITKANLDKVPPQYTRKQTIANGERFITPELKEVESKILGAEERSLKLEYDLFQKLRESVLERLPQLQQTAAALGSFAETARLFDYCRPEIGSAGVLELEAARHPVLEQNAQEERFVPNDTRLGEDTRIMLITGPNMAGKSTYIRQVALLALLAHTGSFLPATRARVDLLDRIFTRIGASDDLARGQSTFMVEMCETANILNNATDRSLVILDEIGRGTSTFDGLSLAWSILEHLHNQCGAKTLFATHYHELTELAARLPRLKNYNVAVREWHDQIVFLRKIVEGGTDKSYGIQVARLAGVPKTVLERAREILHNLEESELTPEGNVRPSPRRQQDREKLKQLGPAPQLDLFAGG
jgi:DNA mismatch repair protein MutS